MNSLANLLNDSQLREDSIAVKPIKQKYALLRNGTLVVMSYTNNGEAEFPWQANGVSWKWREDGTCNDLFFKLFLDKGTVSRTGHADVIWVGDLALMLINSND
jgi:hypothetical protein